MAYRHCGIIIILLGALLISEQAWSFNSGAHSAFTAAALSRLDANLRQQHTIFSYDMPNGIGSVLGGGRVDFWTDYGVRYADKGDWPTRHFHKGWPPGLPWSQSGLFGVFESAPLWAQDLNAPCSETSVTDALFRALVATDTQDRQLWYAQTLFDLFCVVHLEQDMGSPAHSRDKQHLAVAGTTWPSGDTFHQWGETPEAIAMILSMTSQGRPQYDVNSQSKLAELIVPLSEYSARGFFDDSTIGRDLAPFLGDLQRIEAPNPKGDMSDYLVFRRDTGESDYRVAKVVDGPGGVIVDLDDAVFADYCRKLCPKVIAGTALAIERLFPEDRPIVSGTQIVADKCPYQTGIERNGSCNNLPGKVYVNVQFPAALTVDGTAFLVIRHFASRDLGVIVPGAAESGTIVSAATPVTASGRTAFTFTAGYPEKDNVALYYVVYVGKGNVVMASNVGMLSASSENPKAAAPVIRIGLVTKPGGCERWDKNSKKFVWDNPCANGYASGGRTCGGSTSVGGWPDQFWGDPTYVAHCSNPFGNRHLFLAPVRDPKDDPDYGRILAFRLYAGCVNPLVACNEPTIFLGEIRNFADKPLKGAPGWYASLLDQEFSIEGGDCKACEGECR